MTYLHLGDSTFFLLYDIEFFILFFYFPKHVLLPTYSKNEMEQTAPGLTAANKI